MVVDEHCHVKGIVTRKVWKKRGCRQWGGRGASRARCAGWREDGVPHHAADLHPLAGSSGVLPWRCTRDSLAHQPIMTHQPAPLPPCRICWGTGSTRRSRAPWGRTRPASTGGAGRRRQRQHEGGGSCVSPALQQYRWSEAGTVVLASEFSRVLRLPAPCIIGE